MSKKNKYTRRGIIALFPAIILSSILLIMCVSLSQSFLAMLYRATIFDEKVQSVILAHSCALRATAKHVQSIKYIGQEIIIVNDVNCIIESPSTTTVSVSVKIGEAISKEKVMR